MGKQLYVVGIGPGEYEQMTIKAAKVLESSDVLVGYTVYIELMRAHFPDKEFLSTGMTQEAKRCRMALERAAAGQTVSVICSGDAGVYGMASLILELAPGYPQVQVEIVPGVTAACAGAALLGAPIGQDFAVISLSDRLTPLEQIEKRLECAAAADMAVCLYNPASRARADYLAWACRVVMRHQSGDTVCGLARNIARAGESVQIMTLRELAETQADMFTTVFIGNSKTKNEGGRMISPRGYKDV